MGRNGDAHGHPLRVRPHPGARDAEGDEDRPRGGRRRPVPDRDGKHERGGPHRGGDVAPDGPRPDRRVGETEMQNPFANPAFAMAELTAAINVIPNRWGRYQALGIFPEKGVRTTSVIVEHKNNVLNLLPTVPRGGPPTVGNQGKREVRSFIIPHIPHDDVVMPEEVQNIRGFGSETEMAALMSVMNEKLATMAAKHDITREWLIASALRGQVRDADNSVLLDFFQAFGITQQTQNFDFGASPAINPRLAAAALIRYMEDNLLGESMTEIRVFSSSGFWTVFITDPVAQAAWDRWQDGAWLRQNPIEAFPLWGVSWEQYRGTASDASGNARVFIPAGEAIAIPMGTMSTFQLVYAPADFNEAANTVGRRMYAKQKQKEFERGWDIHTQSNPLPLCFRPKLLVRCTQS